MRQVAELLDAGEVSGETFVWRAGMGQWLPLARTALAELLRPPELPQVGGVTEHSRRRWIPALAAALVLVLAGAAVAVSRGGAPDGAMAAVTSGPTAGSPASDEDICDGRVAQAKQEMEIADAAPSDAAFGRAQQRWVDVVLENPDCFEDDEVEIAEMIALGEVDDDSGSADTAPQALHTTLYYSNTCHMYSMTVGSKVQGRVYGDGMLLANYVADVPYRDGDMIRSGERCAIPITVELPDTSAWTYTLTWTSGSDESEVWMLTTRRVGGVRLDHRDG